MATSFGAPLICPVLIGRAPFLAALQRAIARARDGAGQVVLVSGDAGIGKSRLVSEVLSPATTQHALVLRAQCFEADRAVPYAPVIEALRALPISQSPHTLTEVLGPLADPLRALLPELAAALPIPPSTLPADPEHQRHRLFHTLTRLFAHVAATSPVILVLEDLQWADDATLQFLLHLSRHIAAWPLLLLATYRSSDVHARAGPFPCRTRPRTAGN